jgi:hypothetical protein
MNDSLTAQPPPDAPMPFPGPEAIRSRRKMKRILWLGGVAVLFVCAIPLSTVFLKQSGAADRTRAMGNARQIMLPLFEFDAEYGSFPDSTTAAKIKADSKTALTLGGTTSNQIFRQLIAYGFKSEEPFYAKIPGSKKPDNLFHDDAHALAQGECGFAYIAGLSSAADPGTPIVVCPLIPGTTLFDPKPFAGKAIVLRVDHSVTAMQIDPSGRVMNGGKDLFDPSQPWWKGKAPDIKWQE